MWFFFGFLTLATFFVYFLHERLHSRWSGVNVGNRSYNCYLHVLTRHHKTTGAYIGVDAPAGFHFAFKPERWTDRFARRAGLSVECQTNDAAFDDRVYVVSDDTRLCALLRRDARVRADILKLFDTAARAHCRLREIRCGAGRLWVHYQATAGFNRDVAYDLARHVGPVLRTLAARLAGKIPSIGGRLRDPFVWRAIALLSISSGLAVNGLVQLFRHAWDSAPLIVDALALWQSALLIGSSVVAGLILLAILFIGYSSRVHLVIAELLIVGSFGALITSYTALRDANVEFDTGPAATFTAPTLDKRIDRDRYGSTTYFVTVRDWTGTGGSREVRIPAELYDSIRVGQNVMIQQKPGHLGYRWLESVALARDR